MATNRKLISGRGQSGARVAESLKSEIRNLARSRQLLKGLQIEIDHLTSRRVRNIEVVTLDFTVPQNVIESRDPATGAIRATSAGAQYTYTFTSALSLDRNLNAFREFYEKRSRAAATGPEVRRQVRLAEQVAVETASADSALL